MCSSDLTSAFSPTEKARITHDGYFRMATNTGGIQFNGDTLAVNALDDYENGTFTPTVTGVTLPGTATYAVQSGKYVKIGDLVTFAIYLSWTAFSGTGNMRVSGLPFTVYNNNAGYSPVNIWHQDLTTAASSTLQGFVNINTTQINLQTVPIGGGTTTILNADTAATMIISGSYFVA